MLKKNDLVKLKIDGVSNDGSGVGRSDGVVVFVPRTVPGDELSVRIVKPCGSYCYGIIDRIELPSPERQDPGCSSYRQCGGCSLRQMSYPAELRVKAGWVKDALRRIGGFELELNEMIPSPRVTGYRNKAQYPVGEKDGRVFAGFYAPRSHRITEAADCPLQPEIFSRLCGAICGYMERSGGKVYDEESCSGLFRHIYLRRGEVSGELLVCLVVNGGSIPQPETLVEALLSVTGEISTVLLNHNIRNTNVILGEKETVLYGSGRISDTLCGVPVSLSPRSFYQVNHDGAELLYREAARMAALTSRETLLDLYCGAGTIGLSMAGSAGQVIGVETVEDAVNDARRSAKLAGIENCRFICGDAGRASGQLASEGLRPDAVVLDPPRKGCTADTLEAVAEMSPSRIVMVSCNPATAARDLSMLCRKGYRLLEATPVDMFPRTAHVESVSLLSTK